MTDKYYVIETVFGYLECVDGVMLRNHIYNRTRGTK